MAPPASSRGTFRPRCNFGLRKQKRSFLHSCFSKKRPYRSFKDWKTWEQKCFILAQLNRDIEETFKMCCICQKNKPNQAKEPLLVAQEKLFPWSNTGLDLFRLAKKINVLFFWTKFTKEQYFEKIGYRQVTASAPLVIIQQWLWRSLLQLNYRI